MAHGAAGRGSCAFPRYTSQRIGNTTVYRVYAVSSVFPLVSWARVNSTPSSFLNVFLFLLLSIKRRYQKATRRRVTSVVVGDCALNAGGRVTMRREGGRRCRQGVIVERVEREYLREVVNGAEETAETGGKRRPPAALCTLLTVRRAFE